MKMSLFDVIKYPISEDKFEFEFKDLPELVKGAYKEKYAEQFMAGNKWTFENQTEWIKKLLLEYDEPI